MKNNGFLNALAILFILSVLIAGCKQTEENPIKTTEEEFVDTGALVVESFPSLAQVYIGEEYGGDTPLTLYNLPVGQYNLIIKKNGYVDIKMTVTIKVGKTEEIDATLKPIAVEEPKPKAEEKMPENVSAMPQRNKINLSNFAMYFDFDKMQFTERITDKSDLFSRKYDTYIHFTALTPTKINVVNKPINEVKKWDCIFADTTVMALFSGQTLCVKTAEGSIVAIGGSWQTSPTELEWVLFD